MLFEATKTLFKTNEKGLLSVRMNLILGFYDFSKKK